MFSIVLRNCLFNTMGKRILNTNKDVLKFNSIIFLLCSLIFFGLSIIDGISLFTALLGILFGVMTFLSNIYSVKALAGGAMHITILITTASMIIPTVFGMILSGEDFNIFKMLAIALLIFFIYLSSNKSDDGKFSFKWLIYCAIVFFSSGIIGILQKIHQISSYKTELFGFLGCSFITSFILSMVLGMTSKSESIKFTKKHYAMAIVSGACIFFMNFINLKLSGIIPSQIFFPLVNGGSIILSSVSSILIFKESITKRQLLGLSGGILSLVAICLL